MARHGVSFPFPRREIDADVPLEPVPLHADAADLELDLHSYERPLAASPFGTVELVPDWDDTHAMSLRARPKSLIDVHGFEIIWESELCKDSEEKLPSWNQVVRRITRDLHTHYLIESLDCDGHPKLVLHRRCLPPGCGRNASATCDIETTFLYRPESIPFIWRYGPSCS